MDKKILFLMLFPIVLHALCDGVWTQASGINDDWGTLSNWQSCIPELQNDSALFSTASSQNVNVNIAPTISSLIFNSANSFFLGGTGPITFLNTSTGNPAILQGITGQHFLDVPIQLNITQLDITINSSASITLQSNLTDISSSSIQLAGPGSFNNSDNSQFSLDGNFSLLSGNFNSENQTTSMSISMNELLVSGGIFSMTNNLNISTTSQNGIQMTSNSGSISSGVINITNTAAIAGDNSNGSEWNVANNLQMTAGTIAIDNQGNITAGIGSLLLSNTLLFNGGTILLTNTGEVSGAFAKGAVLSVLDTITMGGGILINGEGSPSTTSVNTAVIVPTFDLNGGTFINHSNVQANSLSIGANGVLGGNGVFTTVSLAPNTVITNSGTVIPGDPVIGGSPAALTIQGSYIQSTIGTLGINFFDQSNFSQLIIAKTANLAGNLELGLTPGFSILPGQTFLILQANGGVTGTFNDPEPLCMLYPTLTYLPNTVEISFTPTMCNYVGEFIEMVFSSINQENNFLLLVLERLRMRSYCLSSDLDCTCHKMDPWNIYIGPVGDFGNVKTKSNQIGFGYWSTGFLTGFDYAFSQGGLGLFTEYERMSAKALNHWGKFHIDYLQTNIYGTYYLPNCPCASFNAVLGGGYQWYFFERNLPPYFAGSVKGSPQGGELDALLDFEYLLHKGDSFQFIPFASLQYIYMHVGKYQEHGVSLFDLAIINQNAQSLRSTLGFRGNYALQTQSIDIYCEGSIGWQREYLDKARTISFFPVNFNAPIQTLSTIESSRNILIGSIDCWIQLSPSQAIEANYSFDWSSLYQDNFFYLGWNMKF